MDNIFEFMKSDMYIIYLSIFCIIIFLLYIINFFKLIKIKKEYKKFIKKLGNGENIQEILDKHIDKINKVITKNEELNKFCIDLNNDMKNCIQKVRDI